MAPESSPFFNLLFSFLFGMVLVWFVLFTLLCRRLENEHPDKYEEMGEPSLWRPHSLNTATGWALLKFLLDREHRELNDGYLSRLSEIMFVFLGIYVLLFGLLFVMGLLMPFSAG